MGDRLGETIRITTSGLVIIGAASFKFRRHYIKGTIPDGEVQSQGTIPG